MATLERRHAARIETVFRAHDADGSGTIDTTELRPALAQLGVEVDQGRAQEMLALVQEWSRWTSPRLQRRQQHTNL